jgi:hypothetical protein
MSTLEDTLIQASVAAEPDICPRHAKGPAHGRPFLILAITSSTSVDVAG